MIITPIWDYTEGSFDTDDIKMVCVARRKNNEVYLCIQDGGNHPVAEIKLCGCSQVDAIRTYNDAFVLCEEIAKRWNKGKNELDKRIKTRSKK
jgi:hypothetical protein